MMRDVACRRSTECGNICDALLAQGLDVPQPDSGCQAPEAFYEDGDQVAANFEGNAADPYLAQLLVSSLYGVLRASEHKPDGLHELVGSHEALLEQRSVRWSAMIQAAKSGRSFTHQEYTYYTSRINFADANVQAVSSNLAGETIIQAQAAFDSRSLSEHGIVFDEQAIQVLDRLASNYLDSKPTLLVGDKGIAKTQLARFMAKFASSDQAPIFISGKGDQMSDEFVGRYEQDQATGQFVFHEGQLIRAMREGLPVIIDEINSPDQSITMSLQDFLLRKPGDIVRLSENGGDDIVIAPGFTVIATANEASERYRHRVTLDPAFRDRFDVLQLSYPDKDNEKPLQEVPVTSYRLALAAVSDHNGSISRHIDLPTVETFVRLAHVTQRLYSTPLEDSGIDLENESTTSFLSADKPMMSDCITPRSVVDTLRRVAAGNKPNMTLNSELQRLVAGLDQAGSSINSSYVKKAFVLLSKPEASV